jgi:Flp pilus assembly pilin Flp
MRRDKGIRRSIRRQDGVVAVEFAIIAPVVLLILVGVIQFGIVYSQYQVLQGAAREGARCASVQGGGFATCSVTTAVENAALGYDLTNPPVVSVDGGGSACSNLTRGRNVTVSWVQTFDLGAIPNMVPGIPDTVDATISGTFRCE